MGVSQYLANKGLVSLRSMGGVDGHVELTELGVDAAEHLIRRNSIPSAVASEAVTELSDRDWAEKYLPMVRLAFQGFARDGAWPSVDTVQRALDRDDQQVDVRKGLQEMPRLAGEARTIAASEVNIPIRILRYLPEAEHVVELCVELVQRAVQVYFSDTDPLQLSSRDTWVALQPVDDELRVAARLVLADFPNPFAGGGTGPDGYWSLSINGALARRFKDVSSIDSYLARQQELRGETLQELAAFGHRPRPSVAAEPGESTDESSPGATERRTVFVAMPFEQVWSAGIYDFIRRAARAIGVPDECVIRADQLTKPGKIDQQIVESIRAASVIVADITDANANVMWEVGYAAGAMVPAVILNQRVEESPFDLANVRQVRYRLAPTDDDERKLSEHMRSALDEVR
jgi:hypothetical protein